MPLLGVQNLCISDIPKPKCINIRSDLPENSAVTVVQHGGQRVKTVSSTAGTLHCVYETRDTSQQAYITKCMFRCIRL
jgi:hypothetical protein